MIIQQEFRHIYSILSLKFYKESYVFTLHNVHNPFMYLLLILYR